MWIELPWIETVRWVRCPACSDRIGVQRVRSAFSCPHCAARLRASPGRALIASMCVGIVLLALTAWLLDSISPSVGAFMLLVLLSAAVSVGTACIVWRAALGLEAQS